MDIKLFLTLNLSPSFEESLWKKSNRFTNGLVGNFHFLINFQLQFSICLDSFSKKLKNSRNKYKMPKAKSIDQIFGFPNKIKILSEIPF